MEFRPAGLPFIPPVVKNLLIINGLVFAAMNLVGFEYQDMIYDWFALHHWGSQYFKIWQIVTHMFMHGNFAHLFSNMFALWMFGSVLENRFGGKRFLNFYIICGIGASLLHLGVITYELHALNRAFTNEATVGASGAVFGLLFAFGYLFPNTELYMYFIPIPIKAKYFVAGYAFFELYAGVQQSAGDNIAHFAHLGGMLVAFILLKIWGKTDRRNFY
jgi:membrane associated rhomboid family serine protease